MYEWFPSRDDEGRMQAFHAASWRERAKVVEALEDDRLRELGRRIVFFERPEALAPERRQMMEAWLQYRLRGREGLKAGRTLGDAIATLEEDDSTDGEAGEMAAIRAWLRSRVREGGK